MVGRGPRAENHLGKVLMVLLNRIWEEGKIPGCLNDAEVYIFCKKVRLAAWIIIGK
jgi:hypothetical protein